MGRVFAATYPLGTPPPPPPRCQIWNSGWAPLSGNTLAPLMRPAMHLDGMIIAPTWQYQPRFLVYAGSLRQRSDLFAAVRRLLPEGLRGVWTLLTHSPARVPQDQARDLAAWVENHGAAHGFRTPSVAECTRALGLEAHIRRLDLPTFATLSAQSDAFDPASFLHRAEHGVISWLHGASLPAVHFPTVAELRRDYEALLADVRRAPPHCSRACSWPGPRGPHLLPLGRSPEW